MINTQEFVIEPGSFNKISKIMRFFTVFVVVVVLIGIALSSPATTYLSEIPYVIGICSVFLLMGWSNYRAIKKQRVWFESYKLSITDNTLVRKQLNTPTIVIQYDDISTIEKNNDGSFMIRARRSDTDLYIPAQVNNYEQLELVLNAIEPITDKKISISQQISTNIAAVMAMGGLAVCVYMANNKILVGASGFLLFGILSFSFCKIQLNKNSDKKTKQLSYFIILILVVVTGIIYQKLAA